jgi:hypothetical protein
MCISLAFCETSAKLIRAMLTPTTVGSCTLKTCFMHDLPTASIGTFPPRACGLRLRAAFKGHPEITLWQEQMHCEEVVGQSTQRRARERWPGVSSDFEQAAFTK